MANKTGKSISKATRPDPQPTSRRQTIEPNKTNKGDNGQPETKQSGTKMIKKKFYGYA